MPATETFTDVAQTTVTAGGNTAPSPGTSETWTVASSASFPAAATGVTQFHIADPALPNEIIAVTNVSGTTWTVTRGAGTNAAVFAHSVPFTVKNNVPAAFMSSVTVGGITNPMTTAGDLIVGGSAGAPTRLPAGTASQQLAVSTAGGNLVYITPRPLLAPPPSGDTTGVTDPANCAPLITTLQSTGGALQFYGGRYYIPQLLLYTGVEYRGVSMSQAVTSGAQQTIITAPSGSTVDMVLPSGSGVTACAVCDLSFDGGNGSNPAVLVQPAFNGININQVVTRPRFDNLFLQNMPGEGITCGAFTLGGCFWTNIRGSAFYGHALSVFGGSDIHLSNIEMGTSGLSCFLLNSVTMQAVALKSNFAGARGVVGDTFGFSIGGSSQIISGGCFAQNDVGSYQKNAQTFTATNASPCVFTGSGSGYANGTPIALTGSVPTGFTASTLVTGPVTIYYVVASAGSTFELAATPGGAAINSTSTGSGTATPCDGNSVYVSGSRNKIQIQTAGATNAHLFLDSGATNNDIEITTTNQDNVSHSNFIYQINANNVKKNVVKIVGNASFLSSYSTLTNSGSELGNSVVCECEAEGSQSVAFAASITPDPWQGGYVQIAALTGAVTINNPANGHAGSRMTLRLLQDGTGGRVVTFGGNYKTSAAIPTTLNTATEITFVCEATGGTWREVSRATA